LQVAAFLICFPFIAAVVLALMKKHGKPRKYVVFGSSALIVAAMLYFVIGLLSSGKAVEYLENTHTIDLIMLIGEIFLMCLVVFLSFRHKKYYAALLSVVQTGLIAWLDLSGADETEKFHIYADKLTVVMCLIIGIVGTMICVYAVGI